MSTTTPIKPIVDATCKFYRVGAAVGQAINGLAALCIPLNGAIVEAERIADRLTLSRLMSRTEKRYEWERLD